MIKHFVGLALKGLSLGIRNEYLGIRPLLHIEKKKLSKNDFAFHIEGSTNLFLKEKPYLKGFFLV